jgi:hypothetical protein
MVLEAAVSMARTGCMTEIKQCFRGNQPVSRPRIPDLWVRTSIACAPPQLQVVVTALTSPARLDPAAAFFAGANRNETPASRSANLNRTLDVDVDDDVFC